jgi:hypothetical protein
MMNSQIIHEVTNEVTLSPPDLATSIPKLILDQLNDPIFPNDGVIFDDFMENASLYDYDEGFDDLYFQELERMIIAFVLLPNLKQIVITRELVVVQSLRRSALLVSRPLTRPLEDAIVRHVVTGRVSIGYEYSRSPGGVITLTLL